MEDRRESETRGGKGKGWGRGGGRRDEGPGVGLEDSPGNEPKNTKRVKVQEGSGDGEGAGQNVRKDGRKRGQGHAGRSGLRVLAAVREGVGGGATTCWQPP